MNDEIDSDLRAHFDRWREQERAQAPDFERLWQRALRREREAQRAAGIRLQLRIAGAGVAALAIIAAGWLTWRIPARMRTDAGRDAWEKLFAPIEVELASRAGQAWTAPTDFLLAAEPNHAAEPVRDLK